MFFEVRGGQFRYIWPNYRYTETPAFQDIGNFLVRGGNRDGWFNIIARNQVLGSLSYFKEGWGGSHNFKVGGEWFRETGTFIRGDLGKGNVPGDVLHIMNNNVPAQVYLFKTPSKSENGLRTDGFFAQDTYQLSHEAGGQQRRRRRDGVHDACGRFRELRRNERRRRARRWSRDVLGDPAARARPRARCRPSRRAHPGLRGHARSIDDVLGLDASDSARRRCRRARNR